MLFLKMHSWNTWQNVGEVYSNPFIKSSQLNDFIASTVRFQSIDGVLEANTWLSCKRSLEDISRHILSNPRFGIFFCPRSPPFLLMDEIPHGTETGYGVSPIGLTRNQQRRAGKNFPSIMTCLSPLEMMKAVTTSNCAKFPRMLYQSQAHWVGTCYNRDMSWDTPLQTHQKQEISIVLASRQSCSGCLSG